MPDHDSPETIIEAVREWQEADGGKPYVAAIAKLRALRLPPEEARNEPATD